MGELATSHRSVALTGARTFLGTQLIRHFECEDRYQSVLAIDVAPPRVALEKTRFIAMDLTLPGAGKQLADRFRAERVDTVVHAAFLSGPSQATRWARDLEELGTAQLLDACGRATPDWLVLVSSTLVYGALPENPNLLREDAPLADGSPSEFIASRARAERLVARHAEQHPTTRACVLRFAPILGPTVDNFFSDFFARPVLPVLMGFDPLIQLVHEHDAERAIRIAVDNAGASGMYNVVGEGIMPYTSILALMGKLRCPLPHFLARPLSRALWATQLSTAPPDFLDFLRYSCVADGMKARRDLGFVPEFDIQRTVLDFLGVADGEVDIAEVYG